MTLPAGSTALVTGATGAIGRAMALALAGRGARLLLTGRNETRLAAAADRARELGAETDVRPLDLAAGGAADELAAHLEERFGGADVLVHALGAYASGTVAETPADELDRQLRINLRAPYALTRRLLSGLQERRGQIVFVNSSAALRPRGNLAAYAASKAALKAVADALRDEVNPDGVRVVSVYPGRTASPMQERVHRAEGKPYAPERLMQPEDVAASVLAALELPRTAEVTDLHLRPMRK
ncbi:MAG: SDR family NAD(P)-dependent oxidoreductase [Thermoanaerobaculia bacterium]